MQEKGIAADRSARDESENTSEEGGVAEHLAGKYMTFKLDDEVYGIDILKVVQLIQLVEITRVPRTPDFIRGLINLRGRVIPVIDLRLKFGMSATKETEHTVIIVVQHRQGDDELVMGLMVDEVLEVQPIGVEDLTSMPNLGANALDTEFIKGLGKTERAVIFLLDMARVLTTEEKARMAKAEADAKTKPGADVKAKPKGKPKPERTAGTKSEASGAKEDEIDGKRGGNA
jgi:purine-binding chemotaxis protein CheW